MRSFGRLGAIVLMLALGGLAWSDGSGQVMEKPAANAPPGKAQEAPKPRQFRLSGRVLLPDDSPAAGATVTLQLVSDPYHPDLYTHRTGLQGGYDFGMLDVPILRAGPERPGLGSLMASLDGYGLDVVDLRFEHREGEQARLVEVTGPKMTRDLRLSSEAVVSGTVLDGDGKPLDGVDVNVSRVRYGQGAGTAYPSLPAPGLGALTDREGRFRLSGLPENAGAECWFRKTGYVRANTILTAEGGNEVRLPLAGAIEGRALFAETGEPVPNLRVYWDGPYGRRGDVQYSYRGTGLSGPDGRFRLEGVPEGLAVVRAAPEECALKYVAERVRNVSVAAGVTTSGVVIGLRKGGILKGRVFDVVTGEPVVASVSVTQSAALAREEYVWLVADKKAEYSVRLPAGAYSVRFGSADGYVAEQGTGGREVSAVVEEGLEVRAPDLKAQPAVRVTVRVLGPDGRPAPGILVSNAGGATYYSGPTRTDALGKATVGNLPPGERLQITARNEEGTLRGEGQVTPEAGDANELVIALKEAVPCAVTGKVVDPDGQPIAGANVSFLRPSGGGGWTGQEMAKTGAQGNFEIKNLDPGENLFVWVRATGYGQKNTDRFSLSPGETHDVGLLTLARADKELKGRVVDRNGQPVAGQRIMAYGRQSENQEALTDKDGGFHFRNLADEELTIYVQGQEGGQTLLYERARAGQTDLVMRIYALGDERRPANAAEVGKPAPELVLEEGAAVRLAQFKGKPVALAFVSIYSRPCVNALRELKALQAKGGAKALAVIAVHDRTATLKEIESFRKDEGIGFPIVRVPEAENDGWRSETFLAYGVKSLPTVALIDAEGKVAFIGDASRLSERIEEALAKAARGAR